MKQLTRCWRDPGFPTLLPPPPERKTFPNSRQKQCAPRSPFPFHLRWSVCAHRCSPLHFCVISWRTLKRSASSVRNQWLSFRKSESQDSVRGARHTGGEGDERRKSTWLSRLLVSGWDPLVLCLREEQRRLRVQTEESCSRIRFPSDGRGLKGTCQLFSMVLIGWVTLSPSTCPWHCAFPLVTVKSRSHWTQRPDSRTISPHLEPITSSFS